MLFRSSDERRVDHVPVLAVVLLFLVDDRVERRAAFAYGERPELGEDVGFLRVVAVADVLDLGDDLLGQVFVVVFEVERVLDGESAADVELEQVKKRLAQSEGKLNNAGFVAKAPEAVIEKVKGRTAPSPKTCSA